MKSVIQNFVAKLFCPEESASLKKSNPSHDLRQMVFGLKPEEIGLAHDGALDQIWGLVFETGMPGGAFSLVMLLDGTTSFYVSTGFNIIGGGQHEKIREASTSLIHEAQKYIQYATRSSDTSLPHNGKIKFSFLCHDGVYIYEEDEASVKNNTDPLSNLAYAAHVIISYLREFDEQARANKLKEAV